ncbi:MAG: penicillin-binding protein activator [Parvularculaceae bacterium]
MRNPAVNALKKLIIAVAALAVAACATDGTSRPPIASGPTLPGAEDDYGRGEGDRSDDRYADSSRYDRRAYTRPPHMAGTEPVRVGLLLPFSADNEAARKIASAMFDAAQLAVFDAGDEHFLLIPKDTKGSAEGAAAAARSALADGAEIILGPMFSESVDAAAPITRAARVPMIAFSSDIKSAGDGVFLLSFPPELEIARVTEFAMAHDMTRFGVLAPMTEYGDRVSSSFAEEVFARGGVIVHEERYEQDPDAMLAPAKRLAKYSTEIIPIEMRHDYDPKSAQTSEQGYTQGFQAVLMPEQGTLLRALAPLLPYYNVDISRVKILGVSSWNNARLAREPALRGGWFAAPDPSVTANFEKHFADAFGAAPPRLASLAYDATLLAARLAANNERKRDRFTIEAIADPNGYFGADGLFRLNADGSVERGLAILEIQPGGIQVIDPAPRSFAPGY